MVAALVDSRGAATALRRTLPLRRIRLLACRTAGQLRRTTESRLIEALVIGLRAARAPEVGELRARFPRLPLVLYGIARAEHAHELLGLSEKLVADALLIEGVDDPAAGDVVLRHGLTTRWRAQLADAPRQLRLTEPLQMAAWDALLLEAGRSLTTTQVAQRLDLSREHLSRQFAAGGAPNLKRVMDFLRVSVARELLRNPGYPAADTARLLGFSSLGLFRVSVRRVARVSVAGLAGLGGAELLRRFLAGGGRSRR